MISFVVTPRHHLELSFEIANNWSDVANLSRTLFDIDDALSRHDVTPVFEALKGAIITGATDTNVNELKLLLVS